MSAPSYIESPAVATALGVDNSVIRAFPELVRRGHLPRPVSLGSAPTIPTGWQFDLHKISDAIRADGPDIAELAKQITAEIRAGGSPYSSPEI